MTSDPMAPRCSAMSKQTGEQCKQRPIPGGTVCRFHGGRAPAVAAAAEQRVLEQKAGELLASTKLWDPEAAPVTDAVGEMQRLAGSLRHTVDVLGAKVNLSTAGDSLQLDPVLSAAWLRVLRELRQLLEGMERLGIAERYVELEADRVRLMATAVGRAFDALGLDEAQKQLGAQVLLETLRATDPHGAISPHTMSPTHQEQP